MSVLGKRIRELRKARDLSQEDLATVINSQFNLNIDRAMVSKWETDFQTPVMNTIVCLAKFFNVSIDYLNGNEPPEIDKNKYPPPNITEDYVTFPVYADIAAGYESVGIENWEGEYINIPSEFLKGRHRDDFLVLRVKGDSMFPTYQDGDKVLIRKQSTVDYSGQVAAIIYDDSYATLKRVEFIVGEDWRNLVPINPNFAPEKLEGERLEHCRIIGVPKLLIREI